MPTKTCKRCSETKDVSMFSAHHSMKDRLRADCKQCRVALGTAWARQNKDKVAARDRRYKDRNREKLRARHRLDYAKNHAKRRLTMNAWTERNREKVRAKNRKWQHDNKEKYQAIMRMVRASRRFSEVKKANRPEIIGQFMLAQDGKCAACLVELKKYHIDHILPAKHGGTNDPSNLQLLCVGCNIRKRDQHPDDFLKSRGLQSWLA